MKGDLRHVLYATVHGSRHSVEQLADVCGVSASYLYRACLDGESGARFPLELLIPLMNATGNYSLLDHIASRCDRLTVDLPRTAKMKRRDPQVVNDITKNFNACMARLLEFFDAPAEVNVQELTIALHKHLCEVAAMKRAVASGQQGDLF